EHREARLFQALKERIESGAVQGLAERLAPVGLADEQFQPVAAAGDQRVKLRNEIELRLQRCFRDPAKIQAAESVDRVRMAVFKPQRVRHLETVRAVAPEPLQDQDRELI